MVFLAFALTSLAFNSFSQDKGNSLDNRLFQLFDKSYIEQHKELMQYYSYYLDNSFYIVSLKSEKPITGDDIKKVKTRPEFSGGKEMAFQEKIYNKADFNVLKYNFGTDYNNFKTYIWKESGIALVFYPVKTFQANYKEFLRQNSK